MIVDHPFVPSEAANPRLARSCSTCSRIPEVHPPGSRDPAVERAFMADVRQLVEQIRGMSWNPAAFDGYAHRVTERLAIGEERYGGTEFLNRDNLLEVAEETPDCSSYGLLEVERLQRDGMDEQIVQSVRSALVTAAAYAAIADEYVLLAKAARAGRID